MYRVSASSSPSARLSLTLNRSPTTTGSLAAAGTAVGSTSLRHSQHVAPAMLLASRTIASLHTHSHSHSITTSLLVNRQTVSDRFASSFSTQSKPTTQSTPASSPSSSASASSSIPSTPHVLPHMPPPRLVGRASHSNPMFAPNALPEAASGERITFLKPAVQQLLDIEAYALTETDPEKKVSLEAYKSHFHFVLTKNLPIPDLLRVFRSWVSHMPSPPELPYIHSYIDARVRKGHSITAVLVDLTPFIPQFTEATLVLVMLLCAKQRSTEETINVLRFIQQNIAKSIPLTLPLMNRFISNFSMQNDISGATILYDELTNLGLQPDQDTYQSMYLGFARMQEMEAAFSVFGHMQQKGIPLDIQMFEQVIEVCIRYDSEAMGLLTLHRIETFNASQPKSEKGVSLNVLVPSVRCYELLIRAYLNKQQLDVVMQVYFELRKANLVLTSLADFNLLLELISKNISFPDALNVMADRIQAFEKSAQTTTDTAASVAVPPPHISSFNVLLRIAGLVDKNLQNMQLIISELQRIACVMNTDTFNILIQAYANMKEMKGMAYIYREFKQAALTQVAQQTTTPAIADPSSAPTSAADSPAIVMPDIATYNIILDQIDPRSFLVELQGKESQSATLGANPPETASPADAAAVDPVQLVASLTGLESPTSLSIPSATLLTASEKAALHMVESLLNDMKQFNLLPDETTFKMVLKIVSGVGNSSQSTTAPSLVPSTTSDLASAYVVHFFNLLMDLVLKAGTSAAAAAATPAPSNAAPVAASSSATLSTPTAPSATSSTTTPTTSAKSTAPISFEASWYSFLDFLYRGSNAENRATNFRYILLCLRRLKRDGCNIPKSVIKSLLVNHLGGAPSVPKPGVAAAASSAVPAATATSTASKLKEVHWLQVIQFLREFSAADQAIDQDLIEAILRAAWSVELEQKQLAATAGAGATAVPAANKPSVIRMVAENLQRVLVFHEPLDTSNLSNKEDIALLDFAEDPASVNVSVTSLLPRDRTHFNIFLACVNVRQFDAAMGVIDHMRAHQRRVRELHKSQVDSGRIPANVPVPEMYATRHLAVLFKTLLDPIRRYGMNSSVKPLDWSPIKALFDKAIKNWNFSPTIDLYRVLMDEAIRFHSASLARFAFDTCTEQAARVVASSNASDSKVNVTSYMADQRLYSDLITVLTQDPEFKVSSMAERKQDPAAKDAFRQHISYFEHVLKLVNTSSLPVLPNEAILRLLHQGERLESTEIAHLVQGHLTRKAKAPDARVIVPLIYLTRFQRDATFAGHLYRVLSRSDPTKIPFECVLLVLELHNNTTSSTPTAASEEIEALLAQLHIDGINLALKSMGPLRVKPVTPAPLTPSTTDVHLFSAPLPAGASAQVQAPLFTQAVAQVFMSAIRGAQGCAPAQRLSLLNRLRILLRCLVEGNAGFEGEWNWDNSKATPEERRVMLVKSGVNHSFQIPMLKNKHAVAILAEIQSAHAAAEKEVAAKKATATSEPAAAIPMATPVVPPIVAPVAPTPSKPKPTPPTTPPRLAPILPPNPAKTTAATQLAYLLRPISENVAAKAAAAKIESESAAAAAAAATKPAEATPTPVAPIITPEPVAPVVEPAKPIVETAKPVEAPKVTVATPQPQMKAPEQSQPTVAAQPTTSAPAATPATPVSPPEPSSSAESVDATEVDSEPIGEAFISWSTRSATAANLNKEQLGALLDERSTSRMVRTLILNKRFVIGLQHCATHPEVAEKFDRSGMLKLLLQYLLFHRNNLLLNNLCEQLQRVNMLPRAGAFKSLCDQVLGIWCEQKGFSPKKQVSEAEACAIDEKENLSEEATDGTADRFEEDLKRMHTPTAMTKHKQEEALVYFLRSCLEWLCVAHKLPIKVWRSGKRMDVLETEVHEPSVSVSNASAKPNLHLTSSVIQLGFNAQQIERRLEHWISHDIQPTVERIMNVYAFKTCVDLALIGKSHPLSSFLAHITRLPFNVEVAEIYHSTILWLIHHFYHQQANEVWTVMMINYIPKLKYHVRAARERAGEGLEKPASELKKHKHQLKVQEERDLESETVAFQTVESLCQELLTLYVLKFDNDTMLFRIYATMRSLNLPPPKDLLALIPMDIVDSLTEAQQLLYIMIHRVLKMQGHVTIDYIMKLFGEMVRVPALAPRPFKIGTIPSVGSNISSEAPIQSSAPASQEAAAEWPIAAPFLNVISSRIVAEYIRPSWPLKLSKPEFADMIKKLVLHLDRDDAITFSAAGVDSTLQLKRDRLWNLFLELQSKGVVFNVPLLHHLCQSLATKDAVLLSEEVGENQANTSNVKKPLPTVPIPTLVQQLWKLLLHHGQIDQLCLHYLILAQFRHYRSAQQQRGLTLRTLRSLDYYRHVLYGTPYEHPPIPRSSSLTSFADLASSGFSPIALKWLGFDKMDSPLPNIVHMFFEQIDRDWKHIIQEESQLTPLEGEEDVEAPFDDDTELPLPVPAYNLILQSFLLFTAQSMPIRWNQIHQIRAMMNDRQYMLNPTSVLYLVDVFIEGNQLEEARALLPPPQGLKSPGSASNAPRMADVLNRASSEFDPNSRLAESRVEPATVKSEPPPAADAKPMSLWARIRQWFAGSDEQAAERTPAVTPVTSKVESTSEEAATTEAAKEPESLSKIEAAPSQPETPSESAKDKPPVTAAASRTPSVFSARRPGPGAAESASAASSSSSSSSHHKQNNNKSNANKDHNNKNKNKHQSDAQKHKPKRK